MSQDLPALAIEQFYLKDVSFENPAPRNGDDGLSSSELAADIKVTSQKLEEDTYEVCLNFSGTASSTETDTPLFIAEVQYAARVVVQNVDEDQLFMFLNAECPMHIFPYLRQVVSSLTAEGGFRPLFLAPMDFRSIAAAEIEKRNTDAKD